MSVPVMSTYLMIVLLTYASCFAGIGRRFALTEVVCFLARLLRTWRVEPILREGESPDEWRRRVMVPHVFMTMGVDNIPVRLMAREKGV